MDKYYSEQNLDEHKKKQKFYEKIGSTLISGIFIWLFWYYANDVEHGMTCWAVDGSNVPVKADTPDAHEVNGRFQTLLDLYAWCTILDAVRELLAAIYFKTSANFLLLPICLLKLNGFVQFAAMIMNHVYRLDHGGKVCSADYIPKEERGSELNQAIYMDHRGKLLWVLLIIYWIGFGLICCCGSLAVIALLSAGKRH